MSDKLRQLVLDAIDRKILTLLQENARLANVELADKVGLSPSPCLRRVRELEMAGVIRHYVTLLDPAADGLPVSAISRPFSGTADKISSASKRPRSAVREFIPCASVLPRGEVDSFSRIPSRLMKRLH